MGYFEPNLPKSGRAIDRRRSGLLPTRKDQIVSVLENIEDKAFTDTNNIGYALQEKRIAP